MTEQAKPVDWTKPLVAVHPDGRRVNVEADHDYNREYAPNSHAVDGLPCQWNCFDVWGKNEDPELSSWRIENREQPPAYPEGMTPELAQRMVEHFKTVCAKYPTGKNPLAAEARAIMAELEPDPLAKAIDDAWVRLPPEWARETFVAHMTSELRKAGATITETKQ